MAVSKKAALKKPSSARGSQKLSADGLSKSQKLSKAEISKILKIIQAPGAELIRWEPYGQPVIDRLRGVVRAKPSDAARIVTELIRLDQQSLGIHVLINGIPPIERLADIQLELGGRR